MSFNGTQDFPLIPGFFGGLQGPVDLGSAVMTPAGGQVFFVRGNGTSVTEYSFDPPQLRERLSASVQKALSYCVASRGDRVLVLPGHTESIAAADGWSNLVAGVQIIGIGRGNSRPTITWTAAASTVLLDVANASIENMILNLEPGTGTVTVTAPITVSAAGCMIRGCRIRTATDANNKTTIPITTTATADDFDFVGNQVHGATAGECTTGIQFVGADRLRFIGNTVVLATSSVNVGPVRFLTTASTDIKMFHNVVRNNKAASVQAITGMANCTGEVDHLFMTTLANDNLANCFSTPASLTFGRNVGVANLVAETAGIFGTVST